jgi:hypothetical protein
MTAAKGKGASATEPPVADSGVPIDVEAGDGVVDTDAQTETAMRTTDTEETSTDRFTKVFVVSAPWDDDKNYDDDDHEANAAAMVQDAINAGLRVVGGVTFEGAEAATTPYGRHGQVETVLTYSAPAVPAHLVGAGPTEALSDVLGTMADVVAPRDLLDGDGDMDADAREGENGNVKEAESV